MDIDIEQYRIQFYQEARDILDTINEDILKAEANPDDRELLNSIFRGIHTIKGSAGGFELNELSEFAHHLEGLLDALRSNKIRISAELVDLILEGCDYISTMIDICEKKEKPEVNKELVERFCSFYIGVDREEKDSPSSITQKDKGMELNLPEIDGGIKDTLFSYHKKGLNTYMVDLKYSSEIFENGYDPVVLLQNIYDHSELYIAVTDHATLPLIEEFNPLQLYLKPTVYLATKLSEDEIKDLAFDPSLIDVKLLAPLLDVETENDREEESVDENVLREFIAGVDEMIETLERSIIDYEKTNSSDALNEVFRIVHTIKGDADYIGLKKMTEFAHTLESLLDRLRRGSIKRSSKSIDIVLKAVDELKGMIRLLSEGKRVFTMPSTYQTIKSFLDGKEEIVSTGLPGKANISEETEKVFMEQIQQCSEILSMNISQIPLDATRTRIIKRSLETLGRSSGFMGITPLSVLVDKGLHLLEKGAYEEFVHIGEEIIAFIAGLERDPARLGEILIDEGKVSPSDVQEALAKQKPLGEILVDDGKVSEKDVQRALKKQEVMAAAGQYRQGAGAEQAVKTMRVDEHKIDRFTNMIGELVVARNTYQYLLTQLNNTERITPQVLKSLKDNLYLFSRVTNDMQQEVMSLRMIPIKGIFNKFTRIVRDISRKQHKFIELITDGEETEIDKKVADMLSDPLLHLVRNACDHGIESPEERRAAGKPEKGTVVLRAAQEGSNIVIKIIDDGRGIDREKLYQKALSMGMDVRSPEDEQLLDLIFMPGVTTRDSVSDISGRGVGMDVVKTTVSSLGGSIRVVSEHGHGTDITLTIPMTIGITVALMVEVGREVYAIPMDYVVETVKCSPALLRRIHDRMGFHYRGEILPVEHLKSLLSGMKEISNGKYFDRMDADANSEISIVIMTINRGKFGAIVDRLVKNMEIAIKPVPDSLSNIEVINGVSVLGDGRVVLVLNPEKLV